MEPERPTAGLCDTNSVARQRAEFEWNVDHQFKLGKAQLNEHKLQQTSYVHAQARLLIEQYDSQVAGRVGEEEATINAEYNQQVQALQQAHVQMRLKLEQQALHLTVEYQTKRAQEDLQSKKYQAQKDVFDAQHRFAQQNMARAQGYPSSTTPLDCAQRQAQEEMRGFSFKLHEAFRGWQPGAKPVPPLFPSAASPPSASRPIYNAPSTPIASSRSATPEPSRKRAPLRSAREAVGQLGERPGGGVAGTNEALLLAKIDTLAREVEQLRERDRAQSSQLGQVAKVSTIVPGLNGVQASAASYSAAPVFSATPTLAVKPATVVLPAPPSYSVSYASTQANAAMPARGTVNRTTYVALTGEVTSYVS